MVRVLEHKEEGENIVGSLTNSYRNLHLALPPGVEAVLRPRQHPLPRPSFGTATTWSGTGAGREPFLLLHHERARDDCAEELMMRRMMAPLAISEDLETHGTHITELKHEGSKCSARIESVDDKPDGMESRIAEF